MKKKKLIILSSICLLVIFICILLINNKSNAKVLEDNQNKVSGMYAIMLETEAGSGSYEPSTSSLWPGDGYIFNETLSKCENGGELTWHEDTRTVSLKTSVSDKCYLYFDKYNPPDVTIATNNSNNYTPATPATLNCTNATAEYNQKYQRIEISQINKYTNCSLTYQTPSSKTYLNNYITGLSGSAQGDGEVVNEQVTIDNSTFNPTTTLNQNNYSNLSNDASSPFTWDSTDKTWTSTNKTNSSTSTITFNPSSNGYYQLCYTVSSESGFDKATFYVDNSQKAQDSGSKSSCVYLGNLTTSNTIKVTYSKDSSSSSGNDNVIFYLQSGTYNENIETVSAGIRYEGKAPNNYVWFNNELWRIIGVFDSASHGQDGQNLVKIIRADSIGVLAWDKSYTNDWTASSLMNLLNGAYLNAQDGTDSGYCYGNREIPGNCDYTSIGISSTYKDMIANVTWYLGGCVGSSADSCYSLERDSEEYVNHPINWEGKIGLMYISDYMYSAIASSCERNTGLDSYITPTCAGESWLFSEGYEWTITTVLMGDMILCVSVDDRRLLFSGGLPNHGSSTRPVLYLDPSVYLIDGSGTENDPYIIGM